MKKDSEGEVISWLREIGELMDYDNRAGVV